MASVVMDTCAKHESYPMKLSYALAPNSRKIVSDVQPINLDVADFYLPVIIHRTLYRQLQV